MKRFLSVCAVLCGIISAEAEVIWNEGFEDSFPPPEWVTNSVDQSATYAFNGTYSARMNATADYLITPPVTNARTLIFWSYTTSSDPAIVVEYSASPGGPWTQVTESPFSGYTEQWNGQWITAPSTNLTYFRFRKTGTGTLYLDDLSIDDGITTSNMPPVLDPIGNRNVLETGTLSFNVTASDPVDGDPITLSATDLPTGAVFTNGLFVWSNAVPAGAYDVTFYATDKDGSDSETISITVSERPKLLISEIADPSGTGADVFRFLELYNAGTNAIDLAAGGWTLSKQVNGGTWYDIPLTGTVAPDSAWVTAYSAADFQEAYGFAPDQESSTVSGNGDDAYFLYYAGTHTNGVLIDAYGEPDTDGTGTGWEYTDSRAVRNSRIIMPNPVWSASEWVITPDATTGDLTPGTHGPRPEFQGLENQFVWLGDNLTLEVTATNTVRTDVITLSATALPAGASFPTSTGTNEVSSTLNWSNPTGGIYTAFFSAAGAAGTNETSITITVSGTSQIDGWFRGWTGDTLFKLTNGQFWQQIVSGTKSFAVTYRPSIAITNSAGQHLLSFSNNTVRVEQIDVTESPVTNRFTGLHYQNIYQLADGTTWQQISFENIASNVSPVTAWRWMKNRQQMMRFLDRNDAVIGTCVVDASSPPANAPIVSAIDGWFRGWKNNRVFVLKNGQFWQQTSLDNSEQTIYSPSVVITNYLQTGNWRMSLAEESGYVTVQQISAVRTSIDGNFYGLARDRFFKLANGQWWRQISSDSSSSENAGPAVILWSENSTDWIQFPDLGLRAAAEQLNIYQESTITNRFTGLRYGNLYQLAGAGDWIQLSFEHINTNLAASNVMLWTEGSLTNMVVRDSRDATIGTCTVADPQSDSDGDGFSAAAEVLAGSDPQDEWSRFELRQTDRYILSWDSTEGRVYTIEWTPSLDEAFQTLENSIRWPQNSWTDTVHSVQTEGFYRISVRLAE